MRISLLSFLILSFGLFVCSNAFSGNLVSVFKELDNKDWEIKAYKHRVKAAQFRIKQSKAQKGFQLSFSSYLGRQKYNSYYGKTTIQTLKYYYAALSKPLYYPLIDAEVLRRKEEWEYSKLELKKTRLDIHRYILQKFLDLKFNSIVERLYEDYLDLILEKRKLIENLLQDKRATNLDLINVELSLNNAEEKVHSLKTKINMDRKELMTYLGKELFSKLDSLSLKEFQPLNLEFLISRITKRENIDVSLAKKNVEIAEKELLRRKYLRYPRVNLQLSYSYTSSSAISIASTDKRIALILNFPIFQGGYVSAERMEALENLKYYQYDLKNKVKDVESKSAVLKTDLVGKLESVELLSYRIKLLKKKLEEVKEGLKAKVFSKFDYLKTKEDLINAEISYWQTIQSAVSDLVDYYYISQDKDYFLLKFLNDNLFERNYLTVTEAGK